MITKGFTITEALTKARDEGGYAWREGKPRGYAFCDAGNSISLWELKGDGDTLLIKTFTRFDPNFSLDQAMDANWLHVTNLEEIS